MPLSRKPLRNSAMAVFTSSGVQRSHSREPSILGLANFLSTQPLADIIIAESAAIIALGHSIDMERVGLLHLALRLADTFVDVLARGLPDLDQPGIGCGRIIWRPRVNAKPGFRLGSEDFVDGRLNQLTLPSVGSCSR